MNVGGVFSMASRSLLENQWPRESVGTLVVSNPGLSIFLTELHAQQKLLFYIYEL